MSDDDSDPRRQFDQKLIATQDADRERVLAMQERLAHIEAAFESFTRDMRRVEQKQTDILAGTEKAAKSIALIASRLHAHAEMEEFQWTVVNRSNDTLADMGKVLSHHVQESGALSARVCWLEKLLWALWGVVGAAGAMLIPYALKGMGIE